MVEVSAEGLLNTKQNRLADYCAANPRGAQEVDSSSKDKEDLCFAFVRHFMTVFAAKYPKKKAPYLLTTNEYGEQKFVCTTLRPNQLPYPELYDMHDSAQFIAGYIMYEPLDPPHDAPSLLPSPAATLATHTGDSFDMAMLLCSILLGSGYDAYVVLGTAPSSVTLKYQGNVECPVVFNLQEAAKDAALEVHAHPEEEAYKEIDNGVKLSAFIEAEKERKRVAMLDTFQLWVNEDAAAGLPVPPETAPQSPRVHAWVLVKAGRRDVKEHVFFEPSTGRQYTTSSSPYLHIENIWNNVNFWVLNKGSVKISEITFDFDDADKWTTLFLGGRLARKGNTLDAVPGEFEESNPATDDEFIAFDPPVSWVPPLSLSRTNYLLQFPPNGQRSTSYFKAKLDRFAKNTHSQGMVMRLTKYHDLAQVIVKEIHEWYEGRKDKMYRRSRTMLGEYKFIEYYHPGSDGEVKCWTEYPGKRIEVDFYVDGRLDRLKRREEVLCEQVMEYFEGRVDRLVSQNTFFSTTGLPGESEKLNNSDLTGVPLGVDTFIIKIVQTYARGPDANAGNDVAQKIFNVRQGTATFQYHNPVGKIDLRVKTFNHSARGVDSILGELNEKESSSIQENESVRKQQGAAITEFKDIFKRFQSEVVEVRRHNEVAVRKQRSVFETALDAVASGTTAPVHDKGATDNADAQTFDYLSPYLRHVRDPAQLTREEAIAIRQNCLDGYKARLVEREKIIQARLTEEKTKLARKQEQYPRTQRLEGTGRNVSDEEYEKQCAEAIFRIHVLEQRLSQHEEMAKEKYKALNEKLSNDERLKNALKL